MKILLLGEYSNVHATLADGLRRLGQEVTVVSNGDFWKDYPRDIDLSRREGRLGGAAYLLKTWTLLPRLRGYDVVQLINPMFLELQARRIMPVYRYLRRHNKTMILGAFGMDYYWVHENITRRPLRYSDFNIGERLRTDEEAMRYRRDWLGTDKERLNRTIADDCDGIVAGLYEYWACYHPLFPDKTTFIPYPINCTSSNLQSSKFKVQSSIYKVQSSKFKVQSSKLRVFIGISRGRSAYKGTDIMLSAAKALAEKYPERMELRVAEGVPFRQYVEMMEGADVILDQLYSYTPSMNPLEAMSHGIICVGGGEPENYDILGDTDLTPIVNVEPTYESVYTKLEQLIQHPEWIPRLKAESVEYIHRYHDHLKVARQYLDFYHGTHH